MTAPASEDSKPDNFDSIPLSEEVRRAVDELGYKVPTPVQKAVFEPARQGHDLVVQARTGTGKTAAFGLPLADGLVKKKAKHVQAIVLCPTRELALQVARELTALNAHTGLSVTSVYGGAAMSPQTEALRGGAQIVVGTPGRVLDHITRGNIDGKLIKVFVLDESDEMLSMGFLPQIDQIWSTLPETHQVLLFSATVPREVIRIAESRLEKPVFITLSGDHIGALEIQHFVYLSRGSKQDELLKVLEIEDPDSAIVFCNTRDETKRIASLLQSQGFAADWLNADLPQNERETVMAHTRDGKLRFLVCTDVAARGIDISHLTHVINYDFPDAAEQYVHRTGRTGRAGRGGRAISLVKPSEIGSLYFLRIKYKIRPIEKQLPSSIELKTRAETDVISLLGSQFQGKPDADFIALARRLATHDAHERIVAGLIQSHLGKLEDPKAEATALRRRKQPPRIAAEPQPQAQKRQSPAVKPDDVGTPSTTAEPERKPARKTATLGRQKTHERKPEAKGNGRERKIFEEGGFSYEVTDFQAAPEDTPPKREPNAAATAPTTRSSSFDGANSEQDAADQTEVYVNVGRKGGATAEAIRALLEENGIPVTDAPRISVRFRNTFLTVKRSVLSRVLEVLNAAQIAGRRTVAEESHSRQTSPE
jgi:ATP-dependent RNA helicase DeaD